MAGNAVVLKPCEVTPVLRRPRRGLPPRGRASRRTSPGRPGRRPDRRRSSSRPASDKVSFTGSVATGRKRRRDLRPQADPVHPRARRQGRDDRLPRRRPRPGRRGRAARLLHEHRPVLLRHRAHLRRRGGLRRRSSQKVVAARARSCGRGTRARCDIGAMFWDRQMDIIEDHIGDAVAKGAKVHVGGRRKPALKGLYSSRPWSSTSTTTWRSCATRPSARSSPSRRCATRKRRSGSRTTPRTGSTATSGRRTSPEGAARRAHRDRRRQRQRHGDDLRRSPRRPSAA